MVPVLRVASAGIDEIPSALYEKLIVKP